MRFFSSDNSLYFTLMCYQQPPGFYQLWSSKLDPSTHFCIRLIYQNSYRTNPWTKRETFEHVRIFLAVADKTGPPYISPSVPEFDKQEENKKNRLIIAECAHRDHLIDEEMASNVHICYSTRTKNSSIWIKQRSNWIDFVVMACKLALGTTDIGLINIIVRW